MRLTAGVGPDPLGVALPVTVPMGRRCLFERGLADLADDVRWNAVQLTQKAEVHCQLRRVAAPSRVAQSLHDRDHGRCIEMMLRQSTHCAIVTLGPTRRRCAPQAARRSSSEKERKYHKLWYFSGSVNRVSRFSAYSSNVFAARIVPNLVVSTAMSLYFCASCGVSGRILYFNPADPA